jgi:hypothetical protein
VFRNPLLFLAPLFSNPKRFIQAASLAALLAINPAARATENDGSVYPVGAETVLQGLMPAPHGTGLATFSLVYTPNQIDGPNGQAAPINFKLRVVANAVKIEHNWGIPVLGGTLESTVALPILYEGLRAGAGIGPVESEKNNQGGMSNCLLVPLGVAYHKGNWHGFYQLDFYTPGAPYSKTAAINIGQHNWALAPVGAFTYLSNEEKWEASSKMNYIVNFKDGATGYTSGNELTWEYTAMRAVSKKAALGINGYLYQQTTDDQQNGVSAANRGRNLAIGPEFRYFLAGHKAIAFKYTRDTLTEDKPRGNSFWFQFGMPINFGKKSNQ